LADSFIRLDFITFTVFDQGTEPHAKPINTVSHSLSSDSFFAMVPILLGYCSSLTHPDKVTIKININKIRIV